MTQELIAQLSQVGGLRVIARPSVIGYGGGIKSPTEIGRELGVETVLQGSVHNRFFLALVLVQTQQYDEGPLSPGRPGAGGSFQQDTLRGATSRR